MDHNSLIQRQQEQLRRLARLSQELAAGLTENRQRLQDHLASADQQCTALTSHLDQQSRETLGDLEAEYNKQLEAARVRFEEQVDQLQRQREAKAHQNVDRRTTAIAAAIEEFETNDLRLRDRRRYDAEQLKAGHQQFLSKCQSQSQQIQQLQQQIVDQLGRRGVALPNLDANSPPADEKAWSSTLLRAYDGHVQRLVELLTTVRHSSTNRFLNEGWSVLLFIGAVALCIVPWGFVLNYAPIPWAAAVITTSLLVTLIAYQLIHRVATRQLRQILPDFSQELSAAHATVRQAMRASERETKSSLEELQRTCAELATTAGRQRQRAIEQANAEFQQQETLLQQAFDDQHRQLEQTWEQEADQIRARYRPLLDERRVFFAKQREQALQQAATQRNRAERQFEREREELQQRWQQAVAEFKSFTQHLQEHCAPTVADLSLTEIAAWQPPASPPSAVRLGSYEVMLPARPDTDSDVGAPIELPALLAFPHDASLLLNASGHGRDVAVQVLQNATLRLLSSFPAGKVRLTIIDPLGLGQNFSAFMHLADYDDRLVSGRIWTEAPHIHQRLMDLTEHMENVIQKYLRNEFHSIQEYNERAGEVAEPFRILVIANYPHQFSDEAMRRLASIAASGPRCGVYTLMSVDADAKLPHGAVWDELQRNAHVFDWKDNRFVDRHEPFADLRLTFDAAPDSETLTEVVKSVGHHAQDTHRVQVPFSRVMPAEDAIWTSHCAEQLTVPLGRSGATQTCSLELGKGTSQHVLIAGKTGSGKSTLLHALITNAAMYYSPDEVQFYLIDFKKGVEFKPYADEQLPHARVIAIESEREFGLSVLHRLDHELRRRGDLFRESGVQSLAAYRDRQAQSPLPRLLLIVDEFQEFFVSDDKVAHEASLLLDRLVRQGRAFGIHVILGSQTLAGAYSLARSTIGQMAVRIALECSAADAHLILSEDNSAARLLGRPGEAIYNDANGRLEGNHPFQVVWLSDEQRHECLQQIRQRALHDHREDPPTIVFEGHAAANLAENADLHRLVEVGTGPGSAVPPRIWLGAPIEIKAPTSVTFRRQGGTNVLIVGASRELARGLLGSSLVSLISTHFRAPADQLSRRARFWVLDGERAEHSQTAFADVIQAEFNIPLHVAGPAQSSATLTQLTQVLDERRTAPDGQYDSIYLVIHDLARFRDLQSSADDFGLGSFGSTTPASPAAQLASLLRDGPPLGMHVLVWADGYHTVSRWFERPTLRDFGTRILFQMSAVDSSHLMDSAAASQLGTYRALMYDHDRGQAERFRPYSLPSAAWLRQLNQRLAAPATRSPEPDQGSAASDAESLV